MVVQYLCVCVCMYWKLTLVLIKKTYGGKYLEILGFIQSPTGVL